MIDKNKKLKKEKVIEILSAGNTRKCARALAHVPESTFYDWLNEDAEFAEACEDAEAQAEQQCLDVVIRNAVKENNLQAAQWYLERRRSTEYAKVDRRILSGDSNNPLNLKTEISFTPQEANDIFDILLKATDTDEPIPDDSSSD